MNRFLFILLSILPDPEEHQLGQREITSIQELNNESKDTLWTKWINGESFDFVMSNLKNKTGKYPNVFWILVNVLSTELSPN